MKTLRYAIVGAGMMGQEHIRNLALIEHTAVTTLCDPNDAMREQSAALARSLGNPCDTLLAAPDGMKIAQNADCIVIASPNHTHINVLRVLMPLDLPMLVEKPLCTTMADLQETIVLAGRRSTPFWVAMEYRYMPPTAQLLQQLASGRIGRVRMLSIREHRYPFLDKVDQWNRFNRQTGGTMVEKCCHYFDLMRLIVQSEPVRVYASGGCDVNHRNERYGGEAPDILDNALAIVDFDNGVRAALDLCMFAEGSEPQEMITAVGDAGKLEVRIPGPGRFWPGRAERPAELVYMPREPSPPEVEDITIDPRLLAAGDHHGATYYQHLKFAEIVRHGGSVGVTLADGARSVAMGIAAEESARTGQAIELSPLLDSLGLSESTSSPSSASHL